MPSSGVFPRCCHSADAVGVVFPDVVSLNRLRVEYDSVVHHGHGCYGCEYPDQVRLFRRTESEEVEIAGGSVSFLVPNDKQHRAFEQEPVGVGRLAAAV